MRKNWRGIIVLSFFCILLATLIGRLVFLQILQHGFYEALAQGQHDSTFLGKGNRGAILIHDKNGVLFTLATTQQAPYVFVSPPEIQNKDATAGDLADTLALRKETILLKIQQSTGLYETIKKRVSDQEVKEIQSKNLKGIYIGNEIIRYYPQNELASQVVGFTNQDGEGQYGVEKYENGTLDGKTGLSNNVRNPAAYVLSALTNTVQNGSDVTLTIDPNIQANAESLLKEANDTYGSKEGTIIVIDPNTGKILALANTPSFNPNDYARVPNFGVFQNGAVEKIFEPGSVFKAITMAGAIDTNSISPETSYVDKGILKIGGSTIYNYAERSFGKQTMKGVLDFSINTGAVFAEQQMGNLKFLDYMRKFGIFKPTNIDLPGEIYSQNKELLQQREINFATASFGQGVEITPMQLIRAYSAIANGGKLPTPYITEGTQPQLSLPIISQETSRTVTSMLVDVLENGFGKAAKIHGYYMAGKTGTSQIAWSSLGVAKSGYSDQTIQSFIGYAPAYNPKFLILVKLNSPNTKTAEYSAEPIFKKLAKYVIDYLEIPPDYTP